MDLELIKEKKCAFYLKWQELSPLIQALDGIVSRIELILGRFKVYVYCKGSVS